MLSQRIPLSSARAPAGAFFPFLPNGLQIGANTIGRPRVAAALAAAV